MTALRTQSDEGAPPPRWGLLGVAIVAALVTASWTGSAFSTANTDVLQARSAQAPSK